MLNHSNLFTPVKVGAIEISSRIVMAPLTRYRATDDHVHGELAKTYYAQRAAPVPGTLLITEGTIISARAGNQRNVPGIYTAEQIEAWKSIVEEVHRSGSYIFLQLWALGRAADADLLRKETGLPIKSSSAVPMKEGAVTPEELSENEIEDLIADYACAAKVAVEQAGFDGVEVHAANGYLIDQFTQDTCNRRQDKWGGSVENRSRFALEVTKAVVGAVGKDRVGIRLSPWSRFQGMRMQDPIEQFSHLVSSLRPFGLAYLHLIESRVAGSSDVDSNDANQFAIDLWQNSSPIFLVGGFSPDSAREAVDVTHKDKDIVIVFGRYFISNPDLVFRIKQGVELTAYDRSTFYTPQESHGYIDYPYCAAYNRSVEA